MQWSHLPSTRSSPRSSASRSNAPTWGGGGGGMPARRSGLRIPPRLLIAAVIALISIVGYLSKSSRNPVTGKTQRISISPQEEVAMGLQAAPEMIRQMGGLSPDPEANAIVDQIGMELVRVLPSEAGEYQYEFHLLADDKTVNAFALPGGQVFITSALFDRLETRGQLAGVLGHEVGHVVGRHSAERIAKTQLMGGLAQAGGVASGTQAGYSASQMVANMFIMKYGRGDELESDRLGVELMVRAGYDPRSMMRVMEILREASGGAARQPEFMSTHPDPGNRIEQIRAHIQALFPQGVPEGLVE